MKHPVRGRPLSPITQRILAIKPGGFWAVPRKTKRATLGSYVYKANNRIMDLRECVSVFQTTTKRISGRKRLCVVRSH